MKKCSFIGHRDSEGIEKNVYNEIKTIMSMGIQYFYSGGMGNFDKMCEKSVKELGGKIVFIPYNIKQVKESDILWYDDIIYPFGDKIYSKSDIPNRNKWIVDNCDLFLCYVHKNNGGAFQTLNYAKHKNRKIINLAIK